MDLKQNRGFTQPSVNPTLGQKDGINPRAFAGFQKILRNRPAGFTFFEVMVTIVILSVGIVIIYQGFLTGLFYQKHLRTRAYAMNLLEHKLATVQYLVQYGGEIPAYEDRELENIVLDNQNITFHFKMDYRPLLAVSNIYEVDMRLSWKEREREFKLSRSAYLSKF